MGRDQGSPRANALPIPVPIAQRLSAIVIGYKTLKLTLEETSFDDYLDAVHSRDPAKLKNVAYPLERALEVVSNLARELVALGLKELGIEPIDAPRDLGAFAAEGAIPQRLADNLIAIHRARNDLQHEYPDVLARQIHPACERMVKVAPAFTRAYALWLRGLGYGVPGT